MTTILCERGTKEQLSAYLNKRRTLVELGVKGIQWIPFYSIDSIVSNYQYVLIVTHVKDDIYELRVTYDENAFNPFG